MKKDYDLSKVSTEVLKRIEIFDSKHSVIIFIQYEDGFVAYYDKVQLIYTNEEEEMKAINKYLKKELKNAKMTWKYVKHVPEIHKWTVGDRLEYIHGIKTELEKEKF